MATTTVHGHVARALEFFERNDIYFAIGHPDPWEGDDNLPPAPTINATDIESVVGYKKVETIYLVVPDENGSIQYRDSRWRIVPADQAVTESARWVYIDCYLRYDELPLTDYRQLGVFSRLEKAEGIPTGKMALLPNEVAKKGILEVIDNRKKTSRQLDQKEQLSIVIEF
ncbi:hypothetical protein D3C74_50870 [compost metagenome]